MLKKIIALTIKNTPSPQVIKPAAIKSRDLLINLIKDPNPAQWKDKIHAYGSNKIARHSDNEALVLEKLQTLFNKAQAQGKKTNFCVSLSLYGPDQKTDLAYLADLITFAKLFSKTESISTSLETAEGLLVGPLKNSNLLEKKNTADCLNKLAPDARTQAVQLIMIDLKEIPLANILIIIPILSSLPSKERKAIIDEGKKQQPQMNLPSSSYYATLYQTLVETFPQHWPNFSEVAKFFPQLDQNEQLRLFRAYPDTSSTTWDNLRLISATFAWLPLQSIMTLEKALNPTCQEISIPLSLPENDRALLQAVLAIPGQERAPFFSQVGVLCQKNTNKQRVEIITTLSSKAAQTHLPTLIELIPKLLDRGLSIKEVVPTILKLSSEQQKTIVSTLIELTLYLSASDISIEEVVPAISKIPFDQQIIIVPILTELLTELLARGLSKKQVVPAILTIPLLQQKMIVQAAASLLQPTMTTDHFNEIFSALVKAKKNYEHAARATAELTQNNNYNQDASYLPEKGAYITAISTLAESDQKKCQIALEVLQPLFSVRFTLTERLNLFNTVVAIPQDKIKSTGEFILKYLTSAPAKKLQDLFAKSAQLTCEDMENISSAAPSLLKYDQIGKDEPAAFALLFETVIEIPNERRTTLAAVFKDWKVPFLWTCEHMNQLLLELSATTNSENKASFILPTDQLTDTVGALKLLMLCLQAAFNKASFKPTEPSPVQDKGYYRINWKTDYNVVGLLKILLKVPADQRLVFVRDNTDYLYKMNNSLPMVEFYLMLHALTLIEKSAQAQICSTVQSLFKHGKKNFIQKFMEWNQEDHRTHETLPLHWFSLFAVLAGKKIPDEKLRDPETWLARQLNFLHPPDRAKIVLAAPSLFSTEQRCKLTVQFLTGRSCENPKQITGACLPADQLVMAQNLIRLLPASFHDHELKLFFFTITDIPAEERIALIAKTSAQVFPDQSMFIRIMAIQQAKE